MYRIKIIYKGEAFYQVQKRVLFFFWKDDAIFTRQSYAEAYIRKMNDRAQ